MKTLLISALFVALITGCSPEQPQYPHAPSQGYNQEQQYQQPPQYQPQYQPQVVQNTGPSTTALIAGAALAGGAGYLAGKAAANSAQSKPKEVYVYKQPPAVVAQQYAPPPSVPKYLAPAPAPAYSAPKPSSQAFVPQAAKNTRTVTAPRTSSFKR